MVGNQFSQDLLIIPSHFQEKETASRERPALSLLIAIRPGQFGSHKHGFLSWAVDDHLKNPADAS